MVHFTDPADREWLAELKESGLLTPDVLERIDAAMGRPESGTLNGLLLAGADFVPAEAWLSWLIRRHGCHRFGRVQWRDEAAAWARAGVPPDGNLQFRRCRDGAPLVAVLRPDLRDATAKRLEGHPARWAAATLHELRDLAAAWRRAVSSGE